MFFCCTSQCFLRGQVRSLISTIFGTEKWLELVVIIKRKTKNTDICRTSLYLFIFQYTLWQRKLSRLSVETRDII